MVMDCENMDRLRVERLAYFLWQQRGSPVGSPEEDWLRAEEQLRVDLVALPLPVLFTGIERKTR
ncbi:MAG: DUF2934 domain-containing protein [Phycisphaeraceae bacterium]|nr:DUF2934 domain-containing protein [Phycisphaeraceae bacterium]